MTFEQMRVGTAFLNSQKNLCIVISIDDVCMQIYNVTNAWLTPSLAFDDWKNSLQYWQLLAY